MTTHKTRFYSKGIMKITCDPFYAECFPSSEEQLQVNEDIPLPPPDIAPGPTEEMKVEEQDDFEEPNPAKDVDDTRDETQLEIP